MRSGAFSRSTSILIPAGPVGRLRRHALGEHRQHRLEIELDLRARGPAIAASAACLREDRVFSAGWRETTRIAA
jgi:hypothetical protein